MAPGCTELGRCPCRRVRFAPSPQPNPPCMCFGQLMGPPCMARQWQEQSPLGRTDFTLHNKALPLPLPLCTRHCQSCRQHMKDAGAMPAKGDKDIEAGVLLAPRDPTTAEGVSGVDGLALCWSFTSQVLGVGCSPLQD